MDITALSSSNDKNTDNSMDNPNVTINDQFAINVPSSLEKYESRQQQKKEHLQRYNHLPANGSSAAEKKPLFASLLNPQWQKSLESVVEAGEEEEFNESNNGTASTLDLPDASSLKPAAGMIGPSFDPPRPHSTLAEARRYSFRLRSSFAPSTTTGDDRSSFSLRSSISLAGDAGGLTGMETSRSDRNFPSASVATAASPKKWSCIETVPEYAPLCERRRRKEALGASAKDSSSKHKPLTWNRPSFQFDNKTPLTTDDGSAAVPKVAIEDVFSTKPNDNENTSTFSCSSSSSSLGKKRKGLPPQKTKSSRPSVSTAGFASCHGVGRAPGS